MWGAEVKNWGRLILGILVKIQSLNCYKMYKKSWNFWIMIHDFHLTQFLLTDDAWVCRLDLAPQKLKLHPKFRHLIGWKNMWKKFVYNASFWDIAVCLHFRAKFKMATRVPKMVTSEVFCCFLIAKVVLSC